MKKRSRKIVKKLTSLMLCIAYFTVILCGSVYMNSINSVNAATEDSGVVDFCAVQTDEDGADLSETSLATGNDAISDDEISDEDQSTGKDSGEENLATPGDSEITADEEDSVDINNATYDKTDFEQYMKSQGFPDSYKPYLREMHSKHPTWIFKAVKTGIDWNTLIENEKNKPGAVKNLYECYPSSPHYGYRSTEVGYNWATDRYTPYDGYVWFAASEDIVKFYIDPRIYLDEVYVFAFEALSYQEGAQNKNGVEAILKGSFMYKSKPKGSNLYYSQIMLNAAKKSGVSAYHIASRIRQEMGSEAGVAALGNSSSYPGIYNFFNIGAYDSSEGNAILNGLRYASGSGSYGRPWNSAVKSIEGGASYISGSFISEGQDTIYTQKFNVTNKDCLFWNQYMSNVQAPSSEAYSQYKAYANNGLLESSIVFKIPVYTNMPKKTCEKPADTGNPNNWLDDIAVKKSPKDSTKYKISPSFSGDVLEYSVTVPAGTKQVYVDAEPVNREAVISGDGYITLDSNKKTVKMVVKAENGKTRTYKLSIVRSGGSTSSTTEKKTEKTTLKSTEKTTEKSTQKTDQSVHKGDLSGDGKINALDIIFIQRLIVGLDKVTDTKKALADINGDGKINALDIIFVQRHIVGLQKIEWK
ncbi:Beta-N-acetylglucosaminidase [Eubacterium ruminantium]|uniref:Beta-N-acetylglucosaminidase n=1 Tax=Eubacterium ruminantium TaxID=42322 RepID=A0A1T4PDW5_9FIRM|nr:dockerin type I domain-containing protein [Eubacterium ruminantium]SCW58238.1 Beta-N-acetylglucosaminidase [Eubacterium ruminantium]SDM99631.1 Beta-N-acetylglucosaminidase [Eubacterium ruminantium]SJZ88998.1 Beta-N-acetylglucosaminidase [Eubacterium ruminantium]